jgi:hypothetical protein
MVHFFQCQFLWTYDFVENLFHVSLLLKRYNVFNTIFLILFPISILTDDARPKKNICVFTVTCQKNLGWVGRSGLFFFFFFFFNC